MVYCGRRGIIILIEQFPMTTCRDINATGDTTLWLRDEATGLVNFRMRWYDPETGRWISKDPIGLSGGLNLYAFCGNDPLNRNDPVGQDGKNSASILDRLKGWWEGFKTAAGPTGISEAAGAVAIVPNLTTVLGQDKEIDRAAKELLKDPEDWDSDSIEEIEKRFQKWSNASQNLFN